jgi:hypothetical protein
VIGTPSRPIIAPHITAWTAEQDLPYRLISIPGVGIGYADESTADRDRNGILWCRTAYNQAEANPTSAASTQTDNDAPCCDCSARSAPDPPIRLTTACSGSS